MPNPPRREVVIRPNRIKWLRENWSHLTQEELALLTGFDMTTVSRHESNRRVLTASGIERYAQVFKIPTWQLFADPSEHPEEDAQTEEAISN